MNVLVNSEEVKEFKMEEKNNKGLSDDAFDAITAVVIIAVAVIGVIFWLSGMPN